MSSAAIRVDEVPGQSLAALIHVETSEPTSVRVTARAVKEGHRVDVPPTDPNRHHQIPLVGMRASSLYDIDVHPVGRTRFRTGPLPDRIPTLRVDGNPGHGGSALTMFSLIEMRSPGIGPFGPLEASESPTLGLVVAVDGAGEIVWYYQADLVIEDVKLCSNGNLLVSYDDCIAREIDLLGRVVAEWASRAALEAKPVDELGRSRANPQAVPVDADSMHHEVARLENGNLLFLSTELAELRDRRRRHCGGQEWYQVVCDVIVEVDPVSGRAVRRWLIRDVFDVFERPGDKLCGGGLRDIHPFHVYPEVPDCRDWAHANAVTYDSARNALIVSLRQLDSVIAIRYDDDDGGPAGSLLWDLGREGTLELEQGTWPSHQHAPEIGIDGSVLMYDNGNRSGGRMASGKPRQASRAVVYDFVAPGRVRQRWEHHYLVDGQPVFSRRLGDANWLSNGNVLITHGNVIDNVGNVSAHIIEVDPGGTSNGDVVSSIEIGDDAHSWSAYRAISVPGLYRT